MHFDIAHGSRLTAIETSYSGYRFRSRLEAKWAVFFDVLGLRWVYEPQGFDLPGHGGYLPDFLVAIKDGKAWIEVKASKPTEAEIDKLNQVCAATGAWGLLVSGDPLNGQFVCCTEDGKAQWNGQGVSDLSAHLSKTYPETIQAATAARGSRFEHGECGAPDGVWTAA